MSRHIHAVPDASKIKLGCLTREGLIEITHRLTRVSAYFEKGDQCRKDIITARDHIQDLADSWGQQKRKRDK